jgi:hypothetical protein
MRCISNADVVGVSSCIDGCSTVMPSISIVFVLVRQVLPIRDPPVDLVFYRLIQSKTHIT